MGNPMTGRGRSANWRMVCAAFGLGSSVFALGMADALAQTAAPSRVSGPSRATGTGTKTEALAGALVGSQAGINALTAFLDGANGIPERVTERAVQLINDLQRGDLSSDPAVVAAAADRISEAAARTLKSAYVFKVQMDKDFNLGPGRTGYDFGPPDTPPQAGFTKITARDPRLGPGDNEAMRRPTGDQLNSDGVRGVRSFRVQAPNGLIRIVLLTDNFSNDDSSGRPFGEEVTVNGSTVRVGRTEPDAWIPGLSLTSPGDYVGGNDQKAVQPFGNNTTGAIVINANVVNGVIQLDFRLQPGKTTYLTGMIVEPATTQSVLFGQGDAKRALDLYGRGRGAGANLAAKVLEAESQIQAAANNLLSSIATAAGPGALANLLNVPDPVVPPDETISSN